MISGINVAALALLSIGGGLFFWLWRRVGSRIFWFASAACAVLALRSVLPLLAAHPGWAVDVLSTILLTSCGVLLAGGFVAALHLLREMSFHRDILEIIRDLDRAICSTMEIRNMLTLFSRRVARFFGVDEILVQRVNPNTKDLEQFAGSSLDESCLKAFGDGNGSGFAGWVLKNRKLLMIKDVLSDPRGAGRGEALRASGIKSYIGAPMIIKGQPVGVMTLLTRKPRHFSSTDCRFFSMLTSQLAIAMSNAQMYENLERLYRETIDSLVLAIETRDKYTKGHSKQVSSLAAALARKLGLDGDELALIGYAGLLHDIGKIGVDSHIIHKSGPLDPEEWFIMKKHPVESAKIIRQIGQLKTVAPWVLHHHERWDGRGYNDGLAGDTIPLGSRILAVADTFSALTSDRPYRRARTLEYALTEIKSVAGTQLDPKIVDVFLTMANEERGKSELSAVLQGDSLA